MTAFILTVPISSVFALRNGLQITCIIVYTKSNHVIYKKSRQGEIHMIQTTREQLIDRNSPVPAYQQIAADIAKRITEKEWNVDDKLPSESQLAAEYHVSRVTLRQALGNLERDNVIERFQGKGAFVKSNPRQLVENLAFPSLDLSKKPPSPLTPQILQIQTVSSPAPEVRSRLNASASEPLLYLQRLFLRGNIPVGISSIWFAASSVPGFCKEKMVENSISRTLFHVYHYEICSIDNYIESVKLDAVEAALLNSVYDAAGLKISSQYLLEDHRPIEYSVTSWLSDHVRFHYEVKKQVK